jgi:hypothetical protein
LLLPLHPSVLHMTTFLPYNASFLPYNGSFLPSVLIVQYYTRVPYSTDTTYIPGTVHNTPRPCYNITYFTRVKSYVIIVQLVQVDRHYTVVGCPTTTVMHIIKNTALLSIINTRDDRRLRGSGSCFARLESQNTCFFPNPIFPLAKAPRARCPDTSSERKFCTKCSPPSFCRN